MKHLFCLASRDLSGANLVLERFVLGLAAHNEDVTVVYWDRSEQPSPALLPFESDAASLSDCLKNSFDMVYFSNAFLLPLCLPEIGGAQPVLISQGYESFCYGSTYAECIAPCPALDRLIALPVPVIATSRSVQEQIRDKVKKESWLVPVGVDECFFEWHQTPNFAAAPHRILLVGDYLFPLKGMADAFRALEKLSQLYDIQLVLVTQQRHGRKVLEQLTFPVEVHYRPARSSLPAIFSSCDVYCCSSWYEGFGLPALECFAVGVPVVSTRNFGVADYGIDGENLLLCDSNNPDDICAKISATLSSRELRERLIQNGLATAPQFNWPRSIETLMQTVGELHGIERPAPFDHETCSELLVLLETAGVYTPLSVRLGLREVVREMTLLIDGLAEQSIDEAAAMNTVAALKRRVEPWIGNENAEYYSFARSQFDLCRLLQSFSGDPNLAQYAKSLRGIAPH